MDKIRQGKDNHNITPLLDPESYKSNTLIRASSGQSNSPLTLEGGGGLVFIFSSFIVRGWGSCGIGVESWGGRTSGREGDLCVWWVAVIRGLEDEYLGTDFCFQFEQ